MFSRYGYTGSNPIGDGHLKLTSDGQGGTQVWVDLDGLPSASGTWLVTTLDHLAPTSLQVQNGHITGTGTTPAGSAVSVGDPGYTAPAGVTSITLTGSGQTVTGNSLGDTFTSNNTGNHLIGGAGNDTFVLGRGGDVATGGGGTDTFVFKEAAWAVGHITDFGGSDVLDLSAMLSRYGYTGSNPVGDGHLKLTSDGQGGTQVWADLDGLPSASGTWLVTTLDHVAATALHVNGGWITA
jgi:Ca2+-binding RTX toxin-like protein